jgi:hypothetical protein
LKRARLRNITRVDHAQLNDYGGWSRTRGWWVRFQRNDERGQKKMVASKLFSDGVHGGKRKALEKAIRYRNQQERKVSPPSPRGHGSVPPGYGYVRRTLRKQRVDWHPHWSAWIRLEARRCASTTWSVTLHGEREAKRRAEAFLERHRSELRRRLSKRHFTRAARGPRLKGRAPK